MLPNDGTVLLRKPRCLCEIFPSARAVFNMLKIFYGIKMFLTYRLIDPRVLVEPLLLAAL